MSYEEILNKILKINQDFIKANKESTPELYFEMLHSYLVEILSGCTEEQFNELAKPFRITLKKFEKELLDCCSMIYCEQYQEYIKEQGLFKKIPEERTQDKIKTVTKCKQKIGFEVENVEGLNI